MIDAGAVRFRPMLLTAMAVVVGAAVILADPIFQGLAIALMAGEIASLLISRMAVPVLYYMAQPPCTSRARVMGIIHDHENPLPFTILDRPPSPGKTSPVPPLAAGR